MCFGVTNINTRTQSFLLLCLKLLSCTLSVRGFNGVVADGCRQCTPANLYITFSISQVCLGLTPAPLYTLEEIPLWCTPMVQREFNDKDWREHTHSCKYTHIYTHWAMFNLPNTMFLNVPKSRFKVGSHEINSLCWTLNSTCPTLCSVNLRAEHSLWSMDGVRWQFWPI